MKHSLALFISALPLLAVAPAAQADDPFLSLNSEDFLKECQTYPNACGVQLVGYRIEMAEGGDICVEQPLNGDILRDRVLAALRTDPELRKLSAQDAISTVIAPDLTCEK